MYPFLLDVTEPDVTSVSGVLDFVKSIWTLIITTMGSLYTTITTNPLLFISVALIAGGAVVAAAMGILSRLGVGRSGRRRRARR